MNIELIEIRDFLAAHHPFDVLPMTAQEDLARTIEIRYFRKDEDLTTPGGDVKYVFQIRSGAVETRDSENQLLARLGEGDFAGIRGLLMGGGKTINRNVAIEDSLVYCIPAETFQALRDQHPQIDYYFAPMGGGSLSQSKESFQQDESLSLLTLRLSDMLARAPITIQPSNTIQEAAIRMRDERCSCLLVVEKETLVGILTDRDLRSRVIAEGQSYDTLVHSVMTPSPLSIESSFSAFDAMLLMSRKNIRHLPVLSDGKIAGCITNTNLIQTQTTSAVYLVGDIAKRNSAEDIKTVLDRIPSMVLNLADAGATAYNIGHLVSALSDAATQRLIDLAEEKFGPPPVPYAWMAAGSQARHEQTAQSDQDNFLLLDDSYDPALHEDYFKQFTSFVCDGLNICGYVYCPGEMMAMNEKWRRTLSSWLDLFRQWIETPEPMALMLSSIFFDLRQISGDQSLFEKLQTSVLEKAPKNRLFLGHMAGNGLKHHPPIGFFRNFVLIRGGDHGHTLDLKHTGVVPIIDLARVYALSAGLPQVNTHDRLVAIEEAGALSGSGASDLRDAFEFISLIRLRHQAEQIRRNEQADNFLEPDRLSSFERTHLKDAFGVVKTMQQAMSSTFMGGRG